MDLRPIGRDAEVAKIRAFLSAASGATAALAITGDAGVGKTVVWRHMRDVVHELKDKAERLARYRRDGRPDSGSVVQFKPRP